MRNSWMKIFSVTTMKCLRFCVHILLGNYSFYRIYSIGLNDCNKPEPCAWVMGPIGDIRELASSNDPHIRKLTGFAGDEAFGFGIWVDGELASVCWFWTGDRGSKRDSNFWQVKEAEAKVVRILTAELLRGRGIAPRLIMYAGCEMKKLGFHRLFARIWHSNHPSIRAFQKAGWMYVAAVVEVFPLGIKKPLRFVLKLF